jgi:uncharacterized protein YpmS
MTDDSNVRRAVLILVALQIASVVLLALLLLRPQADSQIDLSGVATSQDVQLLDTDIQKLDTDLGISLSASCSAIVDALPATTTGLTFGTPAKCP